MCVIRIFWANGIIVLKKTHHEIIDIKIKFAIDINIYKQCLQTM